MILAMGDMGWPAFVLAYGAIAMTIGLQWRLTRRLDAIEAELKAIRSGPS